VANTKARWVVFERHLENRLFAMARWPRPATAALSTRSGGGIARGGG